MQMQMGMGAGQNMGFDASKAYKQERESLMLHSHEWKLNSIERKILGDKIEPKKEMKLPVEMSRSKFSKASRRR